MQFVLSEHGLLLRSENSRNMTFLPAWTSDEVDEWLHTIFDDLFSYLDFTYSSPGGRSSNWVLLNKTRSGLLEVLLKSKIDGADLDAVRGSKRACEFFIGKFLLTQFHLLHLRVHFSNETNCYRAYL